MPERIAMKEPNYTPAFNAMHRAAIELRDIARTTGDLPTKIAGELIVRLANALMNGAEHKAADLAQAFDDAMEASRDA
jgi:hypothetical protein